MTDFALRTDDQDMGAPGRAAGSSFYFAMRILPRARRDGMFEIYSFCRRIDDIADLAAPRRERLAGLARWRAEIDALYAGAAPPEHQPLARAIAEFGLRKEDFIAVIEGMEMDAAEDIRAPDLARLDLYCDRVASAVGRLSVRIFGVGEPDGQLLAHHLGRALQLTNILRDLDEDASIGRLYLPRELLQEAGIRATTRRRSSRIRRSERYVRGSCNARATILRKPTRSWTAARARACGRRASWARSIAPFSTS